jgi:hypothetical protein
MKMFFALYAGFFKTIKDTNKSGKSEEDKLFDAKELFRSETGRPFKHHDGWISLKDCAKFLQRDDDKEKDDIDAGHSSSAVSIGPSQSRQNYWSYCCSV